MTILCAENVYKVFGRRPADAVRLLRAGADRDDIKAHGTAAVIDASFEVEKGETFVVMGLSGSGKSTLIRMLNGLWRPTAGRIRLGDADLGAVSARELRVLRQQRVSMVFQHFALLPHRTIIDNAAYPLAIRDVDRAERRRRAGEALEMVGLGGWEDHLPAELSGGMRQRVGLARALAADTDVLLMDEAFSALDPLIRREMQDQLVELQHTLGKTIVFITHDLNEAMRLGDRIAVMRDGRIVQIGTSEQILSEPANDYVAQFVADVDRTRVLTASSVMVRPKAVVVVGAGPRGALREMREAQTSAAYLVDRDRRLLGALRDDDVLAGQRRGVERLVELTRDEVSAVAVDAPLAEVFAPSAETPLPLPVVDDAGRLVGVIPRVTLLEAMASGDSVATGPAAEVSSAASAERDRSRPQPGAVDPGEELSADTAVPA
ncbi:quaternary amine ABC transporter ATP-binding protein [Actinotalea fermentans]|uniref:Glycine/betaine ABC transporter ATP-binding protein n=1 Tax=Actinotalea fermentans TaxID=43671 RepID=A0A511YSY1_9CELL|nr:glycine betaine/L-proline ABC transporter ATP-binding protein [Actinotalea fermentans]KGM16990.1 glycine/betaine ABC transporter ATPase [Actinotalea fermentans ATCC 43279 = JCM 9966 = DSM 3133]GEN78295.1 glycine/betaine ABC transporter ATP-binding protein [Actinotalea fermentans]